jgi:hypothetical protein
MKRPTKRGVVAAALGVLAIAWLAGRPAHATTFEPLRVAIDCQGWGRTKACPAFLLGFLDETPLLVAAPRSEADVVLIVHVTFRASEDLILLRFTSTRAGLPPVYEVVQAVDTRATDDEQRAQLREGFVRGVAVYLALRIPEAVKVELRVPDGAERAAPPSSPWSESVWLGGHGSWSRRFQNASLWTGFHVSRVTARSIYAGSVSGGYSLSRQPPLVVEGQEISLDVDSYSAEARVMTSHHLSPHWSVGSLWRGGHEDQEGRYLATVRDHVGLSHDWFFADDPRGNALSVAYLVGAQADWYNATNVLGEDRAAFPSHGLLTRGSVRKDKVGYGLRASVFAMLLEPTKRYVIEVSPNIEIQVGDHVDLDVSLGLTKQAVPGPRDVDAENFEEVTRASYAEPLQVNGFFSIRLHWDRTNAQRNDRFDVSDRLGNLGTL